MSAAAANLFRITSIVILIQLLLGGLVTFNFMAPTIHIITGFIVFVLAIATMVVTLRGNSRSSFRTLRGISIGLVTLIVIQMILGFVTLASGSSVVAWVHFGVAMGIYAMSVAGSVMAFMWVNMSRARVQEPHAEGA